MTTLSVRAEGRVTIVTIERPERRNAVDLATARALYDAFKRFDADPGADVAVLTGAGGAFCAGADLKALAEGETGRSRRTGDFGPMGPTRLKLAKPVIAAIEGLCGRGRNGARALVRPAGLPRARPCSASSTAASACR